jgi:hypothetical protein
MGRDNLIKPGAIQSDPAFSGQEMALAGAVADYLERRNNGQQVEISAFVAEYPALAPELKEWLGLFVLPVRTPTPSVEAAWDKFKARVFTGETVKSPSLGDYVRQVSSSNELAAAGFSPEAAEAIKKDPTPVGDLKNYDLPAYAALARRYGVKDAAFPRLLKWLKGLAHGFSSSSGNTPMRGMAFARDAETRQPELTREEVSKALKKPEEETGAEKDK